MYVYESCIIKFYFLDSVWLYFNSINIVLFIEKSETMLETSLSH